MNYKHGALVAAVLAMTSAAGTPAWADRGFPRGPAPRPHHHHHHPGLGWIPGLVLGSALVWSVTRPVPVHAEPAPVVVVPPRPIVQMAPSGDDWWYYCRPANAYYPYVQSCPVPWERVPAQPPGW